VQEAAALVAPELAERRIEVRIEGDPGARAHVEADPVARVLSQLLLDVATGHAEGSTIDVQIRATAAEGFQLQVMDPGGARDPKDATSTFEPFSSLLSRGTGLSLAALSRVMESHGGKLSADWSSGRGTLYTLRFPG
jgi:signal transduction histidine kinase